MGAESDDGKLDFRFTDTGEVIWPRQTCLEWYRSRGIHLFRVKGRLFSLHVDTPRRAGRGRGLVPAPNQDFYPLLNLNLGEDGVLALFPSAAAPTFTLEDAEIDCTVQAGQDGLPIPIWRPLDAQKQFKFDVTALVSSGGLSLPQGGQPFQVAGIDFSLTWLALGAATDDSPAGQVLMQGKASFGNVAGVDLKNLEVVVDGGNYVIAQMPTADNPSGVTLTGRPPRSTPARAGRCSG